MSIIIVGNGTSILDNENGSRIDAFETVLRFNSFKIKDYEKHTGIKTNIWFTVNKAHKDKIHEFDEVIVHSWEWIEEKCDIYQKLSAIRDCKKTTKDFVNRAVPTFSPSSGLIAIYMMLDRYEKVCITGFDWWDREKHHYGDKEVRGTLHKPQKEFEVIQELIKRQRIYFL